MAVTLKKINEVAFLEWDQPDAKVNLVTPEALGQLDGLLDTIASDPSIKALVITSRKKGVFIAGADIKQIEGLSDPQEGEQKAREGQRVLNKLEDLNIPTIAVINGVALGGGCELALACRYRLSTYNEAVAIGLPEVNLGFIPGFGGTYRLPRLIGLTEGLKMILSGKPVDRRKALRLGLIDHCVMEQHLHAQVCSFVEEVLAGRVADKRPRRLKKGLAGILEDSLSGQWLIFRRTRQSVLRRTKGFYPAPLKAVEVIRKTFFLDRSKGLEVEAKAFGRLAVTEVSKNCVRVFYLRERYRKYQLPHVGDSSIGAVGRCGVVGAGVMGGGIAQLVSSRGIPVRLKDVQTAALAQGLRSAHRVYQKAVERRRFSSAEAATKMALISGTLDYYGFSKTDVVIEAVVEDMTVKKKIFQELDALTGARTILATNTSALSVSGMASVTRDPSRVIGIHFFNPVHRMPLVEIVTTDQTSMETVAGALRFVQKLGKIPILVKDSCGFLVNRILLAYINEAGRLLEETGQLEEIDALMTDFGMPMGPFLLSDEVGLDVGLKVLHVLADGLGGHFQPVEIFEKMAETKHLGKKTGQGYYWHNHAKKPQVNPLVERLLGPRAWTALDPQESLDRMVCLMINEAAECLLEGLVEDASSVDAGMVFGTGFPAFRGGLLRHADRMGISTVVEKLMCLRQKHRADRFDPSEYLLRLRKEGRTFYHEKS